MKHYKFVGFGTEIEFKLLPAEDAERFNIILSNADDPESEEYLFNLVTEKKYDLNTISAGTINTILFLVFKLSGVLQKSEDIATKIEEARHAVAESVYSILFSHIIRFMPSYNIDILELKPLDELMRIFATAEAIAGQPLLDTNKMREMTDQKSGKSSTKGLKGTNKAEIQSILSSLDNLDEFDGML